MMEDVMMKRDDDVLIEVLISLPVKSLVRFKCVSKCWRALIESPTFVTRHLKCDKTKEILLLKRYIPPPNSTQMYQDGDDILSFHDPDSPNLLVSSDLLINFFEDTGYHIHEHIHLYGPCNGLICLLHHDLVILSNPALREFEELPPCPFAVPEGYRNGVVASGFGFDANTNAYKVVCLWELREMDAFYVWADGPFVIICLYDTRTHSWKSIDHAGVVLGITYNPLFSLFFNGAWHWQLRGGIILSFEISSEIFHRFEYPHFFDLAGERLMVLNECLAVVRKIYDQPDGPGHMDIWVMKEYGVKESWIKELVLGPVFVNYNPLLPWKKECLFLEICDVESESDFREPGTRNISELASCALHAHHEMKKYQVNGMLDAFRALIFKESLVSLNQASSFRESFAPVMLNRSLTGLRQDERNDALFSQPNRVGIGVLVARNLDGNVMGWETNFKQDCFDPKTTEAFVALSALKAACDFGWKKVIFEGDCKIQAEEDDFSSIGNLISDIHSLSTYFDVISFPFFHRDPNVICPLTN